MRAYLTLVVTALVLLSGFAVGPVGGNAATNPISDEASDHVSTANGADETLAPEPTDPDSDVLGWENGYWYNETLSVVRDDGINRSERRKIVARAMARVERIRGLEFQKKVPVKVLPREQFQQRSQDPVEDARRTFDNVKFEALFMVNESTNSLVVQERNAGSSIGGFYSPTQNSIVVISERRPPTIDELTLAHELVHALQDQHFNLSGFERPTREEHNEIDGLVEGDANYVQYLYTKHCNRDWNGTCLRPTGKAGGGAGSLANVGVYLLKYHPYSDGPPFVSSIRDADATREGFAANNASSWEDVNAMYEDPPNSTEQIIHPKLYDDDLPSEVELQDKSNEDWRRIELKNRVDYAEFGEAGLFTMFVYPGIATQGEQSVIPPESFFTRNRGTNETTLDAYNYSNPITAGWDGDKLFAYANEEVPENETGYVWKTAWDSERDAEQFAEAYRKLLDIHGARGVEGRPNAWVIPDDREFADAFHVERRGDTVVIVNAPTVDQLSGVYSDVTPDAASNSSA